MAKKKRGAQDATLINTRTLRRDVDELMKTVRDLAKRIGKLDKSKPAIIPGLAWAPPRIGPPRKSRLVIPRRK